MRETKSWGEVLHVLGHDQVSVCRINAGGMSSIHRHRDKLNVFVVVSGDLDLLTFGDGPQPNSMPLSYRLPQSREAQVMPGLWHQFRALTDVVLVEVYQPICPDAHADLQDIDRWNAPPAA